MRDLDDETMRVLLDVTRNLAMRSMDRQALGCLRAMVNIMLSSIDHGQLATVENLAGMPGLMMLVKPGDFISNEIIKTGSWEPEVTEKMISIAGSTKGLMVDVGANMGYFSLLWAALDPGNRVVSIEPVQRNISIITANIRMNGLDDRITLMPNAASNRRGLASFDTAEETETGHGGFSTTGSGGTNNMVTTIMLDDYFDRIDLLKIDVEGADSLVLMGANRLLMDRRIGTILYEVNEPRCKALGIPIDSASDFLRAHGYQVELLVDYGPGGSEWIAKAPS